MWLEYSIVCLVYIILDYIINILVYIVSLPNNVNHMHSVQSKINVIWENEITFI